jgi:hypothetical protein
MNRRLLLQSLAAAGLTKTVSAKLLCADFPGFRRCEAGIDSSGMNTVYAPQQASQWCWAACLQMVFTYWGHPVSQRRIVSETWGGLVNMPASPIQIIQDLNRSWEDDRGRDFEVAGDVFSANAVTAAQDLANDCPLILGSLGHAMVLTSITYQGNAYGQVQILGAKVRDPWPGRGLRELTLQEYAGAMMLARIRVA